ncbi:MAG: hypothetical protein WDW36_007519 [Sanguina aurantia]
MSSLIKRWEAPAAASMALGAEVACMQAALQHVSKHTRCWMLLQKGDACGVTLPPMSEVFMIQMNSLLMTVLQRVGKMHEARKE